MSIPTKEYPGVGKDGGYFWILPKAKYVHGVPADQVLWQPVYVYPDSHPQHGLVRLLIATVDGAERITGGKMREFVEWWCPIDMPPLRHPKPAEEAKKT